MSVTEKDENGSEIGESPAAENIMDAESEEDISLQRGKARESSHRNQISNTNNNFYKQGSQDTLQNLANERPKSSKGGVRSSIQNKAVSSQAMHTRSKA